jgi:hypothetical protein
MRRRVRAGEMARDLMAQDLMAQDMGRELGTGVSSGF